MIVETSIHSFSLRHHFTHKPKFNAFTFTDLAKSMGFSGISLSLNDKNYRHLGSRDKNSMTTLRDHLKSHNMKLEIDTSDTTPTHMYEMIKTAHIMGAVSLRTYTRHKGKILNILKKTTEDLKMIANRAQDLNIVIVLENHEDFTGSELAEIVAAVDHPNIKILYDYGNSQMVFEDPLEALLSVLPYIHSVHLKDHVIIRAEHAGSLTVAGVPIGEGFLPLANLTKILLDNGLRNFCFENVWGYRAPIKIDRCPLGEVELGKGSFAFLEPPFNPNQIILDKSKFSPKDLVYLENEVLKKAVNAFFNLLLDLGAKGSWLQPKNLKPKNIL